MEIEIAKYFLTMKDSCIFDVFKIITGKTYIIITVSVFVVYAIYRLKIRAINFILAAIISISVSDVICYRILKPAIGRLRPNIELKHLDEDKNNSKISYKYGKKDFSMPSNHASNIFAFFIVYFLYVRKYWIAVLLNSLLIAVSRVVLVKHYLSDVFIGIVTGILIGTFIVYLFYYAENYYKKRTGKII